MKYYKNFLTKICDIENVSVKELMEITGKSQSVVYSWLNLSKEECFPSIESLGKILFRLGISFDDFINCRHPLYDDGQFARVYYRYVEGYFDSQHIKSEILELPNADEVIKTYLFDRMCLNNMINDYINGIKIDVQRFDFLCKALMPFVVSEFSDLMIYNLHSDSLYEYKLGIDHIKEIKDEEDGNVNDFDMPLHQVYYPDASRVILLAAVNSIKVLNDYLTVADNGDKRLLLKHYLDIRSDDPTYDKNNKIIKMLVQYKCEFYFDNSEDIVKNYRELLKKIL